MGHVDDDSTSSTLLRTVVGRDDPVAWADFIELYKPFVRRCCAGLSVGLRANDLDDVCQEVWLWLAGHLGNFQYDSTQSFRGWLRRVCRSRVHDYLRRQGRTLPTGPLDRDVEYDDDVDTEEDDRNRNWLFGQADKAVKAVKERVSPQTWRLFEATAIKGRNVKEVAASERVTIAAAYEAKARVLRRLREEGLKRLPPPTGL